MPNKTYIDAFDPEKKSLTTCANCGVCLQRCPVMKMDKEESKKEIVRLLKGEEPERVLNECTFCFGCNHYCPHGLKPYALIMERLAERTNKRGGIPTPVRYAFNGDGDSCMMWDVYENLTPYEKAILDKWQVTPPKSKEVLFIGCIGREIPYGIEHSIVLQDLPKYGPRDSCCGELTFRFGDYQAFSKRVDDTLELFKDLDTERLVCYCGSCANFLGNIWPNYHGVKLPFEVTSIWEWLWERVQKGKVHCRNKLSGKVAVHDSCYGSELGDSFFKAVRGLHEAVGLEVVELENNRYDGLSCGMLTMARNFNVKDVMAVTQKKIEQVTQSGVLDVTTHCPGCYDVLATATKESDIKCHYGLEEILWALGDEVEIPLIHRLNLQKKMRPNRK